MSRSRRKMSPNKSCDNCTKQNVCKIKAEIFKIIVANASFLKHNTELEIDLSEINCAFAKRCKEYEYNKELETW
jgi:hypothetical protein